MKDRSITLLEIPITPPLDLRDLPPKEGETDVLEIKVSYDEGGISYATHRKRPRGYTLLASPFRLNDCGPYSTKSCVMLGKGGTAGLFLEHAKRFSKARLARLAGEIRNSESFDLIIQRALDLNQCQRLENPTPTDREPEAAERSAAPPAKTAPLAALPDPPANVTTFPQAIGRIRRLPAGFL